MNFSILNLIDYIEGIISKCGSSLSVPHPHNYSVLSKAPSKSVLQNISKVSEAIYPCLGGGHDNDG